MKVTEHLDRASEPLISFEIIPPLRGGNFRQLTDLIETLAAFRPPFIDITSHAAQVYYEETRTGLQRKVKRKRPGTMGVCALIQNKYDIDAVPHVLCNGFTREETEDFLIELNYLGIDNILAVRGDESDYQKPLHSGRSINNYAEDLVQQVAGMNHGKYLEDDLLDSDPSDFCVGVGGYPEKHFESPNLESDIRYTKRKVDAGGDYIVTQMFFDNRHYANFVTRCREGGIEVPIIPGLKILTSERQLRTIPKNFFCEIPAELAGEVEEAGSKHVREVGIGWTVRQVQGLLEMGAPAVHLYVMQGAQAASEVMRRIKR